MNTALDNIFPPEVKHSPENGPKVGDVLRGSYGYEASISEFVKVVAVTAKKVRVVYLPTKNFDYTNCGMDWKSTPILTGGDADGSIKSFKLREGGYSIKGTCGMTMTKWNGEPVRCYNYH